MSSRPPLRVRIVPRAHLDAVMRQAMWDLFCGYYQDIERARFEQDLDDKDYIIVLENRTSRELAGFSTQKIFEGSFNGKRYAAIFSGDTVIDRRYWGQTALQRGFLQLLIRTKMSKPTTPFYWFLISKGYKTYLLMSRNFLEYWPRRDTDMPRFEQAILDDLATRKFGDAYCQAQGIIDLGQGAGRLKDEVAPIPADAHPEIRFFADRNPGHAQGHELCCLARVDFKLCVSFGWRNLVVKALRPRPAS